MISVKDSSFFKEVTKEFNYPFGNIYIFNGFVISEINKGVNFSWDNHGKLVVADVSSFLKSSGHDLFLISNRINSYSVLAVDWLKYFKMSYSLKAYFIVSGNDVGTLNSSIEKLFFRKKIKHFKTLNEAVSFAKKNLIVI